MYVFKTNRDFDEFRRRFRASGAQVGFVPTMGALHEGHLSLIRQSLGQNDLTVCSIFVNPTQFNQARDLEKYPRIPEKDIILLEKAGCHVLYMPAVGEIYPDGLDTAVTIDLQGLDERMEGRFRPGHFKGVMQV
ncbi:MAG TPA: pantoate--beta-alanine ligase, partial [Flavilitoribacter sp.]|nr:pantoate--beta-alanine ligase [Flavilitoribacter sp.]